MVRTPSHPPLPPRAHAVLAVSPPPSFFPPDRLRHPPCSPLRQATGSRHKTTATTTTKKWEEERILGAREACLRGVVVFLWSWLLVMKVQCDVCKGEEAAAVFCCADEAALCGPCDGRVHSANKLAGKHRRFSLHPASPQQLPLCDICQEKRAFLFCQEDRAILCRDCDASIHNANDLTRKHNRFLLTGIKVSPPAAPEATFSSDSGPSSVAVSSTTATTSMGGEDPPLVVSSVSLSRRHSAGCAAKQYEKTAVSGRQMIDGNKKAASSIATGFSSGKVVPAVEKRDLYSCTGASGGGGGSSISEYLMKELPGWHVEDLLLESFPPVQGAIFLENLAPFREEWLDDAAATGGDFPAEDGGKPSAWWAPQVPQFSPDLLLHPAAHDYHQRQQLQPSSTEWAAMGVDSELTQLPVQQLQHHRWTADDAFTVPDLVAVNHNPTSYKKARLSCWGLST